MDISLLLHASLDCNSIVVTKTYTIANCGQVNNDTWATEVGFEVFALEIGHPQCGWFPIARTLPRPTGWERIISGSTSFAPGMEEWEIRSPLSPRRNTIGYTTCWPEAPPNASTIFLTGGHRTKDVANVIVCAISFPPAPPRPSVRNIPQIPLIISTASESTHCHSLFDSRSFPLPSNHSLLR